MRHHDRIKNHGHNELGGSSHPSLIANRSGRPLQKMRQLNRISNVFSDYFTFSKVETEEEKALVSQLRYEVFCEELGFEFGGTNNLEYDEFDERALMCLLTHKGSNQVAGTIRLIETDTPNEYLPIEITCPTLDPKSSKHPRKLKRKRIGEVSRLAVSPLFRRKSLKETLTPLKRRKSSSVKRMEKGEDLEQQCFSFISVALYCAAAVLARNAGKEHIYVIIKPSLARSLNFLGIKFNKIGSEFEYQGNRAPYYLNSTEFFSALPTSFHSLIHNIDRALNSENKTSPLHSAMPSSVARSSSVPPKFPVIDNNQTPSSQG